MLFSDDRTLAARSPALSARVVRELRDHHQRIGVMLEDALAFWIRAVDWDQGGFFGKIDYDGEPLVDARKHLVQQVRHLWTFGNVHRLHAPRDDIARICAHQFRFVKEKLFVPGKCDFHTVVSADGQPVERGTHHYLLGFAIYGLASHALAFPDAPDGREALEIAKAVLSRIEEESYHRVHGFDERVYPSRWCRHAKEINTQMHLLEAIAELYQAAVVQRDGSAERIGAVLHRQLDHVCFRGIVRRWRRYTCARGYSEKWRVTQRREIDYGHDIEVVYLVMAAAEVLGRHGEAKIRKRVARLGRSVTIDAYDEEHGKWFYSGDPRSGAILQRVSNVWTNFEALNGLFTTWELTDDHQYLEKFGRVLSWLETKQVNPRTGEWYYNVDDSGAPVDVDVFGNRCEWMTFGWKSSYHSLRALISRKMRIEDILASSGSGT